MALLNAISLQMFQNKMKFSLTVPSGNPAEHLKMFRKCVLSAMINALVTINTYIERGIGRCEM